MSFGFGVNMVGEDSDVYSMSRTACCTWFTNSPGMGLAQDTRHSWAGGWQILIQPHATPADHSK